MITLRKCPTKDYLVTPKRGFSCSFISSWNVRNPSCSQVKQKWQVCQEKSYQSYQLTENLTGMSNSAYPHCLVQVGSRNGFGHDLHKQNCLLNNRTKLIPRSKVTSNITIQVYIHVNYNAINWFSSVDFIVEIVLPKTWTHQSIVLIQELLYMYIYIYAWKGKAVARIQRTFSITYRLENCLTNSSCSCIYSRGRRDNSSSNVDWFVTNTLYC